MSQQTKMELVERWRPKYQRVGKRYKSRLLDKFCDLTGHNRKHAIKLMRGKAGIRKRPPGRKKTYGEDVVQAFAGDLEDGRVIPRLILVT